MWFKIEPHLHPLYGRTRPQRQLLLTIIIYYINAWKISIAIFIHLCYLLLSNEKNMRDCKVFTSDLHGLCVSDAICRFQGALPDTLPPTPQTAHRHLQGLLGDLLMWILVRRRRVQGQSAMTWRTTETTT